MLGVVISVLVSTGVSLVVSAATTAVSLAVNVSVATAQLGYAYLRRRQNVTDPAESQVLSEPD